MKLVKLESVIDLADSGTWGDEATPETGSPVLRSSNIHNSKLFIEDVAWRSIPRKDINRKKLVNEDIIVTASSGSPELIGKCAFFKKPDDAHDYYFSNFTFRLRANREKVVPKFLFHWLTSNKARSYLRRMNDTTSGLRNLNKSRYLQQDIPLLSLDGQRRIAAVLDKSDALREKRRQAIDTLDTLLQSVFLDMFGDPISNPKCWKRLTIEEMPIKVSDGNYSSKYPKADEFVTDGVPFIRANNLKNMTVVAEDMRFIRPEKHLELLKGHLEVNDLLITTRGEIGTASLVPPEFEGANINSQIVLLRSLSELVDPYYLLWVFNDVRMKRHMQSHQTGSALKQLPVGRLLKISLPVPPKELQEQFADICTKTRPIKVGQLGSEKKANLLFHSLQQCAFSGALFKEETNSGHPPKV